MAPYGIKSVFVPANFLRDEIKVGYMKGGADEPSTEEFQEAPADPAPQDPVEQIFEPADDKADDKDDGKADDKADGKADDKADGKDDETVDDKDDAQADDKDKEKDDAKADAEADDKADAKADDKADAKADDKIDAKADAEADDSADADDQGEGVPFTADDVAVSGADGPLEELPNLEDDPDLTGGGYSDMQAFDGMQNGGGMFSGPDVFNVMRTMLTSSATGASVADLFEDAVYESTIIKGHLDSIAQSLAVIAEKYAGRQSQPQSNNNGRNRGRGRGDKGRADQQWNQEPEPAAQNWDDEDQAAAE